MHEVMWKGKPIVIKNDRVRCVVVILHRVTLKRELLINAQQLWLDMAKLTNLEQVLQAFDKIFVCYTDAIRILKEEHNLKQVSMIFYLSGLMSGRVKHVLLKTPHKTNRTTTYSNIYKSKNTRKILKEVLFSFPQCAGICKKEYSLVGTCNFIVSF